MSFVTCPVASIIVSNRFRKEPGDIQALAENIHEIGLLHPIAVTPDGRLIAGARRLMAFKYFGRTDIPVHVVDLDEIVRGEFAENVHRKSFLPSELDAVGQEISKLEAERARARQGTRRDLVENCHDVEFGKTRDKVATQLGTSGRNLDKIRYVMRAAEDDPERFGKYAKEMDETENVDRAYKQAGSAECRREEEPPDCLSGGQVCHHRLRSALASRKNQDGGQVRRTRDGLRNLDRGGIVRTTP